MNWALKRTTQCKKCPWRKDVDPHEIPNGYDVGKHQALASTIADPHDVLGQLASPVLRTMACHELHDAACIGWLVHQVGPGNNVALRIKLSACSNADKVRVKGEQHATFEDTLPKEARP